MRKFKIRAQLPWIAYPGSTVQQNYAEDLKHGYLVWDIESSKNYKLSFEKLPNPKPFVTLNWDGNVENIISNALTYPKGSRFRIKSNVHVSQHDIHKISSSIKKLNASEITFKIDHQVDKKIISTGSQVLVKNDLRNVEVLSGLVREYHAKTKFSDEESQLLNEEVKGYLSQVITSDDVVRNTKWSLRNLKFDNVFAYGEGNIINFDSLNGIVGIFGPNRAGKSSIVGTIMYSLFNSSDRGSIKNLYVCNIRKPHCYAKAIINVNGTDYVLERQTTKHESKKGIINAITSLNVFRINESGDAIDLAGEQRNDTEKVIKGLIGNSDDFLLTSLSAQGEINQFISHGSTKRKQILSRFLDLDIFDKMYDVVNKDINVVKAQLKSVPEKDWSSIKSDLNVTAAKIDETINEIVENCSIASSQLSEAKTILSKYSNFTYVTDDTIKEQERKISDLLKQKEEYNKKISNIKSSIEKFTSKIETIETLKKENNVSEIKKRLEKLEKLESNLTSLKHFLEKETTLYKQQERSLKILSEVPCDDKFPNCKFIKDAHVARKSINSQKEKVDSIMDSVKEISSSLGDMKEEGIREKLEKMQKLQEMHSNINIELSKQNVELVKLENLQVTIDVNISESKKKLEEMRASLENAENSNVITLKNKISELSDTIKGYDVQKIKLAGERGKILSDLQKIQDDQNWREKLCSDVKSKEFIASAFSKKGIPSDIVSSQLPAINAEITKILAGIVDFTVELEMDSDSDWMEIYINYGDSRRVIELASGMEKMISSVAIRVALINISTLPKTDMFIIDEGFGALDDAGVEACNRLLVSLKRYFKTIFVITHVDGIKDSADHVIEISKSEKDAKVIYDA